MSVRAYSTMVRDESTGVGCAIATIAKDAVADENLARLLRDGHMSDFLGSLGNIDDPAAPSWETAPLVSPGGLTWGQELRVIVATVLTSRDLHEALAAWQKHTLPVGDLGRRVDDLLASPVLVETSEPRQQTFEAAALAAAGAVGAAATTATGHVIGAIVAAPHIGGLAIVIAGVAGPLGIVVVGAGGTYVTWRLLTGRRRRERA